MVVVVHRFDCTLLDCLSRRLKNRDMKYANNKGPPVFNFSNVVNSHQPTFQICKKEKKFGNILFCKKNQIFDESAFPQIMHPDFSSMVFIVRIGVLYLRMSRSS